MSHTDLASVQCGKYAHYASVSLFGMQSSIDSDRVHIAKKTFYFLLGQIISKPFS